MDSIDRYLEILTLFFESEFDLEVLKSDLIWRLVGTIS